MERIIFGIALLLAFGVPRLAFAAHIPAVRDIQAPVGMVYDGEGTLYVAEWGAGRVSKFDASGVRTSVAEGMRSPSGLAFDGNGTLYAASYGDGCIYALERDKAPRRIASGFASPTGMIWDGKALLVANRNAGEVVRVFLDGKTEVVSSGHKTPVGIARLADGSLVVSCYGGSVDLVSPGIPGGAVSTLTANLNTPGVGIIPDGRPDGSEAVLVVDYGGTSVQRVTRDGKTALVAEGLGSPVGLARMPDGRIIVGSWSDNAAYIITLEK